MTSHELEVMATFYGNLQKHDKTVHVTSSQLYLKENVHGYLNISVS